MNAAKGVASFLIFTGIVWLSIIWPAVASADDDVHVFYLHGRIIEEKGPTPTHPQFGLYDYPAVVEALGSRGATVISEQRKSGTRAGDYAVILSEDIEALIDDGVSPSRIVVVGFSKGGGIAINVSDKLNVRDVRYVLLASCGRWIESQPDLRLSGSVLSVFETSDRLGTSCQGLADRGDTVVSFDEIEIDTGKKHGAFYLPDPIWLDPVLDWIHGAAD